MAENCADCAEKDQRIKALEEQLEAYKRQERGDPNTMSQYHTDAYARAASAGAPEVTEVKKPG